MRREKASPERHSRRFGDTHHHDPAKDGGLNRF
jgi:hypothetical protein